MTYQLILRNGEFVENGFQPNTKVYYFDQSYYLLDLVNKTFQQISY